MLNTNPLHLAFDPERGRLVAAGDITHAEVDRFAQQLRVCAETGDVVVDLTEVTYLPSAAVGAMARARSRAAARRVDVRFTAEPGTIAHRVLEVMAMLVAPPSDDPTSAA